LIKEYLEIGKIVGTHGLRGELRVDPWCDGADFFKGFQTLYFEDNGSKPVRLLSARGHGNIVLLCLAGVESVEQAQALRGKLLYFRRAEATLPPGKNFIAELVGCAVRDADDETLCYGTLTDVLQTGANDVWQITARDGKNYLVPAIADVVMQVDVEKEIVHIRPLKGIFDAD